MRADYVFRFQTDRLGNAGSLPMGIEAIIGAAIDCDLALHAIDANDHIDVIVRVEDAMRESLFRQRIHIEPLTIRR